MNFNHSTRQGEPGIVVCMGSTKALQPPRRSPGALPAGAGLAKGRAGRCQVTLLLHPEANLAIALTKMTVAFLASWPLPPMGPPDASGGWLRPA